MILRESNLFLKIWLTYGMAFGILMSDEGE